jgi:hypothetical protein
VAIFGLSQGRPSDYPKGDWVGADKYALRAGQLTGAGSASFLEGFLLEGFFSTKLVSQAISNSISTAKGMSCD